MGWIYFFVVSFVRKCRILRLYRMRDLVLDFFVFFIFSSLAFGGCDMIGGEEEN